MKLFKVNPLKAMFVCMLVSASLGCGLLRSGSSNVQLAITGLPAYLKEQSFAYNELAAAPGVQMSKASGSTSIRSITLTVSGPDMDALSYYYAMIPHSISVDVPAGKAREFKLYVYVDASAGNPMVVVDYLGTKTTDLEPDGSVTLTLQMIANDTKLVVPDNLGARLVIMNNMQGDGWIDKTAVDFGLSATDFNPFDVDFDAAGSMYVASYPLGGINVQVPFIMKIDNLNVKTVTPVVSDYPTASPIKSLAIDRERNMLYYIQGQFLQGVNLANNSPAPPSAPPINFNYVAVDKKGKVYLSGYDPRINGNGAPVLKKYDLQFDGELWAMNELGSQVLDFTPGDILVKDNYLLVLNPNNQPGFGKMYKMDLDLKYQPVAYGNDALTDVYDRRKGYFYHPDMFFATTNQKIYLIDDAYDYPFDPADTTDRIISFDNVDNWFGWIALKATEAGQAPFRFYQDYAF